MEFNRNQLNNQLLSQFEECQKEEPETPKSSLKFRLIVPALCITIVIFVVCAWYFDMFAISQSTHKDSPVIIKADIRPVRIRPENPGGLQIPNRDKRIYDTISLQRDSSLPNVTRILPQPEEPIAREELVKQEAVLASMLDNLVKDQERHQTVQEIHKQPETTEQTIYVINKTAQKEALTPPQENNTLRIIPVLKEKTPIKSVKNIKKKSKKTLKEMTASDVKTVPTPNLKLKSLAESFPRKQHQHRVQIGSYKAKKDVETSWNNLQKKHHDILGKYQYFSEKADLGQRGIFYRLKVGPFHSEADARKLCQKLQGRQQGCFYIKN